MKKIIKTIFILVALLLSSCKKEEILANNDTAFIDLLKITNDNNGIFKLHASALEFFPHNTHGIERIDHGLWSQGIACMENGFYIMSQNLKEKDDNDKYREKYTLFNLYNPNGESIGNIQVNYPSHGQDLSIEKISNNIYYLYSASPTRGHISKFELDTSNINFSDLTPKDIALDIRFIEEIDLDIDASSLTASLNEKKNKIVSAGYMTGYKKLKISINSKSNLHMLNNFEFDISDNSEKGFFNQGIAMQGDKIYLLRGHYYTTELESRKKLFIFDANSGKLLKSFTFSLVNYTDFNIIEPEGLMIQNNELFVCLPTKNSNNEQKIRLYKLLDIE